MNDNNYNSGMNWQQIITKCNEKYGLHKFEVAEDGFIYIYDEFRACAVRLCKTTVSKAKFFLMFG